MSIVVWLTTHWVQIVAAYGGIIMAARLIVKLTPTPNDDTALEKIIEFMKHLGLHVSDSEKKA